MKGNNCTLRLGRNIVVMPLGLLSVTTLFMLNMLMSISDGFHCAHCAKQHILAVYITSLIFTISSSSLIAYPLMYIPLFATNL